MSVDTPKLGALKMANPNDDLNDFFVDLVTSPEPATATEPIEESPAAPAASESLSKSTTPESEANDSSDDRANDENGADIEASDSDDGDGANADDGANDDGSADADCDGSDESPEPDEEESSLSVSEEEEADEEEVVEPRSQRGPRSQHGPLVQRPEPVDTRHEKVCRACKRTFLPPWEHSARVRCKTCLVLMLEAAFQEMMRRHRLRKAERDQAAYLERIRDRQAATPQPSGQAKNNGLRVTGEEMSRRKKPRPKRTVATIKPVATTKPGPPVRPVVSSETTPLQPPPRLVEWDAPRGLPSGTPAKTYAVSRTATDGFDLSLLPKKK